MVEVFRRSRSSLVGSSSLSWRCKCFFKAAFLQHQSTQRSLWRHSRIVLMASGGLVHSLFETFQCYSYIQSHLKGQSVLSAHGRVYTWDSDAMIEGDNNSCWASSKCVMLWNIRPKSTIIPRYPKDWDEAITVKLWSKTLHIMNQTPGPTYSIWAELILSGVGEELIYCLLLCLIKCKYTKLRVMHNPQSSCLSGFRYRDIQSNRQGMNSDRTSEGLKQKPELRFCVWRLLLGTSVYEKKGVVQWSDRRYSILQGIHS